MLSLAVASLLHAGLAAQEPWPGGSPASAPLRGAKTLLQWSEAAGGESDVASDELEPLATDRPDFTEASSTVGRGVMQFEFGYLYFHDNDASSSLRCHSMPEVLLRAGVLREWLELRVGWNYEFETVGGHDFHGSEDLYVGMKLALTEQHGLLPEMAVIPQMTVPTGSSAMTADEVLPGVNCLYGWDINDFLSTAGSTQFNRALDGDTQLPFTEWAQSWTIGYSLTEQLGAFTEWFAFFPHSADTAQTQHYFDGGFTRRFGDNVQWDIRAGVGLNEAADDYFVGTGLAIRLP